MAGIDHILGIRMAEWLRPGLWGLLTIKLRGIEPGQILTHKKSIGWAVGTEITSRSYYGWHRPHFLEVRMVEWFRPGLWEVLTIKMRGIEPGHILTHKKSIGWADGDEKHVPSLLWLA